VGGPEWLTTERYDIIAKADRAYAPGPDGAPPEVIAMVRTLLAQRFALRLRAESRELPVYELRTARSDGRLGVGMRRVEVDCEAEARKVAALALKDQSRPPARCDVEVSSTQLVGRGLTPIQIATAMSRVTGVGRAVVDRTGLTGTFDINLRFTPEPPAGVNNQSVASSDAPSLFTALQEQLGLKLEPSRSPVEVLVIDSVERPTPD
jgi:uncharacterized protein (TIGR03435 family)